MTIEMLYLQARGATGLLGLTGIVARVDEVIVDPIGGPAQVIGTDYRVTGVASNYVLDIGMTGSDFYRIFQIPGVTGTTVRVIYDRT